MPYANSVEEGEGICVLCVCVEGEGGRVCVCKEEGSACIQGQGGGSIDAIMTISQ